MGNVSGPLRSLRTFLRGHQIALKPTASVRGIPHFPGGTLPQYPGCRRKHSLQGQVEASDGFPSPRLGPWALSASVVGGLCSVCSTGSSSLSRHSSLCNRAPLSLGYLWTPWKVRGALPWRPVPWYIPLSSSQLNSANAKEAPGPALVHSAWRRSCPGHVWPCTVRRNTA